MKLIRSFLTSCIFFLLASSVWAQGVSEYIPYQGFLYDNTGTPLNATVSLTFKLYTDSTSPNSLWEETIPNVSVQNGSFSVNLGQLTQGVRTYFTSGEAHYISIAVDGSEFLQRQRLGSQPYAFLSYNALRFDGQPVANFATQADLANVVATAAGLTAAEVTTLINDILLERAYLNQAQVQTLIDNSIAGLINDVSTLTTRVGNLEAQVGTLQGQVNTLETTVDNLENTVNTLQQQITNLTTLVNNNTNQINNNTNQINNNNNNNNNNVDVSAEILGQSAQTSLGKITFNGLSGVRGATEMCKATFNNVATAHLCTREEITKALGQGNYPALNSTTWIADSTNLGQTCQDLLYDSQDVAVGMTITVNTNYTSNGGGGNATGPVSFVNTNQSCRTDLSVLCCR